MQDFYELEDQTGVRSAWNEWPGQKTDMVTNGVPLSLIYTPTKRLVQQRQAQYHPVRCQKCQSVLNPFNRVDYVNKGYQCAICNAMQQLPASYQQITQQMQPAELHPSYQSLEYIIRQEPEQRTLIFMIDMCMEQEEFDKAKESLQLAIDELSDDIRVCLITFGTTVFVHELKFNVCPRKVVFRSTAELTTQIVEQQLNLRSQNQRFILPLGYCRDTLCQIIEDLHVDLWNVQPKHRPFRCTGQACAVAVSISSAIQMPLIHSKKAPICSVIAITAGPCTSGPGLIVEPQFEHHLRHWTDIQQRNSAASHCTDALKFYTGLAQRAAEAYTSFSVFSCSLDQVGLYEMRPLVASTGGQLILSESMTHDTFTSSFKLLINGYTMGEEGDVPKVPISGALNLQINCGTGVECRGVIGNLVGMKRGTVIVPGSAQSRSHGNQGVYDSVLSEQYRICGLTSDGSVLFLLDSQDTAQAEWRVIQLQAEYTEGWTGRRILRVTTVRYPTQATTGQDGANGRLGAGLDTETAGAVIARLAAWRFRQNPGAQEEAQIQLDRRLVRICRGLADFVPGDQHSVRLSPSAAALAELLYHYRRSDVLRLFGQSPDQTTQRQHQLLHQTSQNCACIMQPVLVAYTLQDPSGQPVRLDSTSCLPDRVLLLDTFFDLLAWTGATVAAWRDAGYHERPEYANVKALLHGPDVDEEEVLSTRFPAPRYQKADQGTSQARILLARVNPASTHRGKGTSSSGEGEVVATDDVDLAQFLDALYKAVAQKPGE